jgi:hypothetical protein
MPGKATYYKDLRAYWNDNAVKKKEQLVNDLLFGNQELSNETELSVLVDVNETIIIS